MLLDPNALPCEFATNAWTGDPKDICAPLGRDAFKWAQNRPLPSLKVLAKPERPDIRDWKNPNVGWGLIIPARPEYSNADNAELKDMPQAVRELLRFRNGVVFGWARANGIKNLIRYLPDDVSKANAIVDIGDIERGTNRGALPHYL